MGSGKSFLGRKIAQHFDLLFADTDDLIEKVSGLSINEIFMHGGESYFRKVERIVVNDLYKEKVIATGAGIVENPQNRDWLKEDNNYVIWLNPSWDIIWERISDSERPKVRSLDKDELYDLWRKRYPLYKECMDLEYRNNDDAELFKKIEGKI